MRAGFLWGNNGGQREVIFSFPAFFKCRKTRIGNSPSGENSLQEWGRYKDIHRWKEIMLIIYFIHEQFKLLIHYFILIISTKSTNCFQFSELSTKMNLGLFFHFNKFLLCAVFFWVVSPTSSYYGLLVCNYYLANSWENVSHSFRYVRIFNQKPIKRTAKVTTVECQETCGQNTRQVRVLPVTISFLCGSKDLVDCW